MAELTEKEIREELGLYPCAPVASIDENDNAPKISATVDEKLKSIYEFYHALKKSNLFNVRTCDGVIYVRDKFRLFRKRHEKAFTIEKIDEVNSAAASLKINKDIIEKLSRAGWSAVKSLIFHDYRARHFDFLNNVASSNPTRVVIGVVSVGASILISLFL